MKYSLGIIILALFLGSCASVKNYSSNLQLVRSSEGLKADVDYAYDRLKNLHPCLYQYISQEDFEYKLDSLKSSICDSITSLDFYFKLSPVIASIRQGHTYVHPYREIGTIKDLLTEVKYNISNLKQFNFKLINDKLIIAGYKSDKGIIEQGAELISVNDLNVKDFLSRYRPCISTDGYNKTFIPHRLSGQFPGYFYSINNPEDSVICQYVFQDTLHSVIVGGSRPKVEPESKKTKREKSEKTDRQLTFPVPDSSIALLDIDMFFADNIRKFYSETFKTIKDAGVENLIIDLRDNPGGQAGDAKELYSYLVDTSFIFVQKSEVVSPKSITKANYFKGNPPVFKAILGLLYPSYMVLMSLMEYTVTRDDSTGRYYYSFPESDTAKCKPDNFGGNVYVLINGGTFSAASILAANLKGSGRAIFVGEETGGAFNSTVAGRMKTITLPESKLDLSFGLANIKPYHQTDIQGRGIMPDFEIKPGIQDYINGKDPALDWIINKITSNQ